MIVDGAAMNNGVVRDGNMVSNVNRSYLVSAMNDCTVLNVHLVTNPDVMHISTHHGIVPDTAVVAHFHITNDYSCFSKKAIVAKFGGYAVQRSD